LSPRPNKNRWRPIFRLPKSPPNNLANRFLRSPYSQTLRLSIWDHLWDRLAIRLLYRNRPVR
jgi:hypothetical protein